MCIRDRGLSALLIIVSAIALGPLLLGQIRLGSQEVDLLKNVGRFLGGLLVAAGVGYLWWRLFRPLERRLRGVVAILAVFAVLAVLTIRFSYMANYVNYDYTNEFMVYAHGAPARMIPAASGPGTRPASSARSRLKYQFARL